MTGALEILPVTGMGDVRPGDDLVAMIAEAAPWLVDGDVLVVTSKIVSKAEGRLVAVAVDGPEREAARTALLAAETVREVARRGPTRIVQTRHGYVMAAAGIDASNVAPDTLVLLPEDPDASARAMRDGFRARGLDVGVVVSDTMGRPWRLGLVDVALGAAGVPPVRDHRGETDPYGNKLSITEVALVDELAAAAELVKGKCDGVPVAVVRGLPLPPAPHGVGAAALIRPADQDLFPLGTAEAMAAGRRDALRLASGDVPLSDVPVDAAVLDRVLSDFDARFARVGPGLISVDLDGAEDVFALGAQAQRLRAALAAEGLASTWHAPGILAVGHPAVRSRT